MSVTELAKELLALPVEQRVDMAQLLWNSLDNHPQDVTENEVEFQGELLRRDGEMTSDPSSTFPQAEVLAEARRRLKS